LAFNVGLHLEEVVAFNFKKIVGFVAMLTSQLYLSKVVAALKISHLWFWKLL